MRTRRGHLRVLGVVVYISQQRGYGNVTIPFSLKNSAVIFFKSVPALFMILIMLGGILGGVFTPTEAVRRGVLWSRPGLRRVPVDHP